MTVEANNSQRDRSHESQGKILRSFLLIGGSQVMMILIRLVRGKVMAFLLGPGGFGLFSIFGSIEQMAEDVAGMGVSSSGARQIAAEVGSGDGQRVAHVATVVRRVAWLLGMLGALALILLSRPISILTFGSPAQTWSICLLSLAVIFQVISYGQDAVILGMQKAADFSRWEALAFLLSTVVTIPVVYLYRERGVVPSLVIFALITALVSAWYRRHLNIQVPKLSLREMRTETSLLMQLGFILMLSSLLQSGISWLVRALILRSEGLEAAGLYQSAWILGGMYVGFVIKAMAADFYPRLTAAAGSHADCNRMVNEQARIGLMLAGPGVLFTLTFCPLIVTMLYSAKFVAAVEVLRWICLGALLQVVTWPMGYIPVAKGMARLYFWSEVACAAVYALLAIGCIHFFGLRGAGVAFLGYCLVHGAIYYPIARRICDFHWTRENLWGGLLYLTMIVLVFAGFFVLPFWTATGVGCLSVLICGAFSLYTLSHLVGVEKLPAPVRKLMKLVKAGGQGHRDLGT